MSGLMRRWKDLQVYHSSCMHVRMRCLDKEPHMRAKRKLDMACEVGSIKKTLLDKTKGTDVIFRV